MRFKPLLILFILLAVLLAGCRGETPQPGATASTTQPPDELASQPATQAVQLASPVPDGTAAPPGCTVVSFLPEPDPTAQAVFPPPGEKDWVRGPETAQVTIVDYSDFQ